MEISYCSPGSTVPVTVCSSDVGEFWSTWYESSLTIEPGSTNVRITFSTRSGVPVYKVDRSKPNLPWVYDAAGNYIVEVFQYEKGDDLDCVYHLKGFNLWDLHVAKVTQ